MFLLDVFPGIETGNISICLNNSTSCAKNTGAEIPPLFLETHLGWRVTTGVALSLSAVIGSLGNFLVIVAILAVKPLRTCGNYFVLNLALADLLVTVFVDPFNVIGAVAGRAILIQNHTLCSWVATFCAPACMGSMWNMCAISLNRYTLICHPNIYHRIFTHRNSVLMCSAIWILCHLVHLPNHIGWGENRFIQIFYLCSFDVPNHAYASFYVTMGVLIPLVGVLFGYAHIYWKVAETKRSLQQHRLKNAHVATSNAESNTDKKKSRFTSDDIKLIKTFFEAFAIFFLCWAPFAVLLLANVPSAVPPLVYVIIIVTAHGNSAVNPIIYGLTSEKFLDGYRKVLGCKTGRVRGAATVSYSTGVIAKKANLTFPKAENE